MVRTIPAPPRRSPLVRKGGLAAWAAVALGLVLSFDPGVAEAGKTRVGGPQTRKVARDKRIKTKKKRAALKRSSKRSRSGSKNKIHHGSRPALLSILSGPITCPADMVAVAGRVCVDRYESSLVDANSGAAWSPFYPPDLGQALRSYAFYEGRRARAPMGSLEALLPLPAAPTLGIRPKAVNAPNAVPQGYLNAEQASASCRNAGKRLCSEAEWLTACRGQEQRNFPYGNEYEQGTCNVYRENHPSAMLHADASRYHDDPRNNLVAFEGSTLLKPTGSYARCASRWGNDAIMDMVGNLDEWVDDAQGVFVGGFFSRGTRAGCNAKIDNHPRRYSDYSLGVRCCLDPTDGPDDDE